MAFVPSQPREVFVTQDWIAWKTQHFHRIKKTAKRKTQMFVHVSHALIREKTMYVDKNVAESLGDDIWMKPEFKP